MTSEAKNLFFAERLNCNRQKTHSSAPMWLVGQLWGMIHEGNICHLPFVHITSGPVVIQLNIKSYFDNFCGCSATSVTTIFISFMVFDWHLWIITQEYCFWKCCMSHCEKSSKAQKQNWHKSIEIKLMLVKNESVCVCVHVIVFVSKLLIPAMSALK